MRTKLYYIFSIDEHIHESRENVALSDGEGGSCPMSIDSPGETEDDFLTNSKRFAAATIVEQFPMGADKASLSANATALTDTPSHERTPSLPCSTSTIGPRERNPKSDVYDILSDSEPDFDMVTEEVLFEIPDEERGKKTETPKRVKSAKEWAELKDVTSFKLRGQTFKVGDVVEVFIHEKKIELAKIVAAKDMEDGRGEDGRGRIVVQYAWYFDRSDYVEEGGKLKFWPTQRKRKGRKRMGRKRNRKGKKIERKMKYMLSSIRSLALWDTIQGKATPNDIASCWHDRFFSAPEGGPKEIFIFPRDSSGNEWAEILLNMGSQE